MQLSESWLRSYCNPPLDTKGLAEVLTMAGMEVEDLHPRAPAFSRVVVGHILSAEQHPNADRLRVCTVDAGPHSPDGPLQIVCGAPNARAGLKAPLALVGAVLPPGEDGKPFTISKGKIRGVESFGMLCAADELGLGSDHAGIIELAADAPVGADLRDHLGLDDSLLTLKLTPNLGHCLSVYGIARELAALTGAPLAPLPEPVVSPSITDVLPVKVSAPDLCGRFTGRIIKGVDTTVATPAWMVRRLEEAGQRSIGVLVDISNYVMFALGQPNHIFDLDRIHGGLEVRWAREGESLELLNGKTITLDPSVGVIADHRAVESLAGIMGGTWASVQDGTTNIYVEAAHWHPGAIAGRARRYNFTTDAGHRFERGVDPAATVARVEYITQLVLEICGGQPGPVDDHPVALPRREAVSLRTLRASKVLGIPLDPARIASILDGLRFSHVRETRGADTIFTVTPPSWRFDITREEDLIEEVIKMLGYDQLSLEAPRAPARIRVRPETRRGPHQLRHAMADLGYHETINFSFVEAAGERNLAGCDRPIRLLNPIAAPLAVMRTSLMASLVQVMAWNVNRKAIRGRIFELGRVFLRNPEQMASLTSVQGIDQPLRLAGLAWGGAQPLQWGSPERPVDFFDIKGDVETLLGRRHATFEAAAHPALHPGRSARILVDGKEVGWVGELHPQWVQSYDLGTTPVLFELEASVLLDQGLPVYEPLPKHLGVVRDLALVSRTNLPAQRIIQAIAASDPAGRIRDVRVFDLWQPGKAQGGLGADERSLALRLELVDPQAALGDEAIQAIMQKALDAAASVGARLRT